MPKHHVGMLNTRKAHSDAYGARSIPSRLDEGFFEGIGRVYILRGSSAFIRAL